MKSKVIIFCVLLFCSKFVVSIPFAEESTQQRAYQPTNWQGNQNIAEHYHGNGFAQAQNLNSHRHEYNHEFINQEGQNFNNYGFNNNPVLQPSPPIKESQNFASDANERKLDNYPVRGDSFPNRPGNRVGNHQYRQNNWQAQNHLANAAASAIAISGAERPSSTVQKPYRTPGQYSQFIPPSINRGGTNQHNQPDRVNPGVRETHYQPVAERPTNVGYNQHLDTNPKLNNRHVHNENHNDAHSATNTNAAKSGNNDFVEKSALYSAPVQSSEGYNGSPAVMSDTLKHAGNHQMRHGYRNTNVPNAYNIARPLPSNKVVTNVNNRHMRNPVINSAPNNQMPASNKYEVPNMPSNTALNNAGHNRYLENGPKSSQPINKYRYEQNPAISNFNNGESNIYNAPLVPNDMEFNKMEQNKYEDKSAFEPGSNYQPPVNTYNEPGSPPNDSIKSGSKQNPLNQPAVAESTYGETLITPNEMTKDRMSAASQPALGFAPNSDSPSESGHPSKNIYNHFYPGPDRGYMENDQKLKDLFAPSSRFVLIHKNGTIKHLNDMEEIGQNNQNYIIVKKNDIPTNNDEYKSLLTSNPPKNSPSYDNVPTEKNPELQNGLRHPTYYNSYTPSPTPQSPKNNEYYPPLGPQAPNSNKNYAPPGHQSLNSNEYYPKPGPQSPNNNEYYPTQLPSSKEGKPSIVTQSSTDEVYTLKGLQSSGENKDDSQPEILFTNKYHPRNRTWDNIYPSSPPKKHAQSITTTTKAPDDMLLQTFLDSLKNDTDFNHTNKNKPSPVPVTTNDDKVDSQNNDKRDNNYTTPSSKLHTHISPGIFKTTTPMPSESSNKKPTHTPIHATPSIDKRTTVKSYDDIQEFLDSLPGALHKKPTPTSISPIDDDNKKTTPILVSHDKYKKKHISPGIYNSTTAMLNEDTTKWDDNYTTPPSKLHTRISPGIFKSTTPGPEKDIQDYLDSVSVVPNKKTTTTSISPTDDDNNNKQNDKNKPLSKQSDFNSHDVKKSPASESRKDNVDKKPISKPSSPTPDYDSSSSESLVPNDSHEYNSTRDDDSTKSPSKLHTVISPGIYRSTTPSDELIQQLIDMLPEKSDDDESSKPSENKQSPPVPKSKGQNSTSPSDSNSTSAATTISPVKLTTEDTIITISPIELQTDNVKDGSTSYPEDQVTPAYDKGKTRINTPPPKETDNLDEVIITIMSDNRNKTSEVKYKDTKANKSIQKAIDSVASVPVTPDDSSAVASNSTKESNTNTGDNSATGDDLLESQTNTSDIVITLTKESDGNVTIKVEVPESTGQEDTSGDDAFVVSINTKNCSADDSVTVKKGETANEGKDKNLVIDLSHSAIFFNQTTDKDIFDEVLQSAPGSVVYVFQIKPQPIIERNKTTIIYANNTVVEEMSETTWQNKDDGSPSVITTKKIYHQGAKH